MPNDPCFGHRILGSPGGKHCESLQRNVWRGVVSPLKAVSLDPGGGHAGYVPSGTPNWHPVLKKKHPKIDSPF